MSSTTRLRPGIARPAILLVVLYALMPLVSARLTPNDYRGGRSRSAEDQITRNSSAIATMLGEFRTSLGDILFIKTERYLHGGVGYEMHHDEDHGHEEEHSHDHDHDHGHEHDDDDNHEHVGTRTLIPSPPSDFRGLVGRLHRDVKPYRDVGLGHLHSDGRQMLPWFKVMTLSDPHYVRGYTAGGYWLSRHNHEQGILFLEQGVEDNPDAFQLHLVLSQLHLKDVRAKGMNLIEPNEEEKALLQRVRSSGLRAAELAFEQWPSNSHEGQSSWTYYDQNDALASFYQAVLSEKRYGLPQEARRLAERYLSRVGTNSILERLAAP